jgi:FMN phosphatase YigB (HAD superfamily)
MNSTFMFGEDRFGGAEDFSLHYRAIGGTLPSADINRLVRAAYAYLAARYPDENFRHDFPGVASAIEAVSEQALPPLETGRIVATVTHHELGVIPPEYAAALHGLRRRFVLAAVVDIWSPKQAWLDAFDAAGIGVLFSALSFSSDHHMVKPSPRPFELVLQQLGIDKHDALMVGDSARRDLGGAKNAGIDCILVGGAQHPDALMCCANLLELCQRIL